MPTNIIEGEPVYYSIPDDLQMFWDHIQVEAAMRNRLQDVQLIVDSLNTQPKTYKEIKQTLEKLQEVLLGGSLGPI